MTGNNYYIVSVKSKDISKIQTPVHNLQKTLAADKVGLCSNGQYLLAAVCFSSLRLPGQPRDGNPALFIYRLWGQGKMALLL